MQSSWFALHTRHQHEVKVTQVLINKGFETFLPTYQTMKRWSDRAKSISLPLFPGYIFVRHVIERRYEVLSTPGVAAIVNVGGVPAPVPEEEIRAIQKTLASTTLEPHPFLEGGDEVCVRSGPLSGLRGFLVRKKDSHRLVVCVQILGRAASTEIDAADVEPFNEKLRRNCESSAGLQSGTRTEPPLGAIFRVS